MEPTKLVCGISGAEIVKGDKYVMQTVEPQAEGQEAYERAVLVSSLSPEEQEALGKKDILVL
jgi:hypothetical protein